MNKFKITWNDNGQVRSKIIESDWNNVAYDAESIGGYVDKNHIMKIELLPEATKYNTEDHTE